MRLGYVLKEFPRLSETFILSELLALERLGAAVTAFTRYQPTEQVPHAALENLRAEVLCLEPLLKERFFEPFEIHRRLARRFGPRHDEALGKALAHRSRQELRYWLLAGAVAEQAVERGLEVLHGHFATGSASVARYASHITGIPYSFTAHAKDIYAADVDRDRLKELLEDAGFVVTVSDANLDYLRTLAPRANVVRVYNGLDLPSIPQVERAPGTGSPLVLCVARLVEKKGIADLIATIAELRRAGRELRCRVVGDGPLGAALRERARELGVEAVLEFTGAASQEQVLGLHLGAAAVFVLPCIVAQDGDRDGLPTTLLEAMAAGVPVVSTRLPGIPEAVPDGEAGLLSDPGDVPGLARAIAATLDDREAAAGRAATARRRVEALFDSAKNAAELYELFRGAGARLRVVG